ncbi:GNAT family N-acetyltransferase [Actinokineospora guangxiensis]|uniref:GNAT family N-acetyltransferase n=1 Tax=Actinokineospora guangxiensis TaxID=1490288 RepID=A0ABW0EUA1_9PSEU
MTRRRLYSGVDDLRAMQLLSRRIWQRAGQWHIGDLAWGRFQHTGYEPQWPTALWEDGGEVVAWGWTRQPDTLRLHVDPERPELVAEVLDWFAGVATAEELAVTVLDSDEPLIAGLRAAGYVRRDKAHHCLYMARPLADLPDVVLPHGFRARPVGADDLDRRVAVHRAAWRPSMVTEESYRAVMAAWPYRADLDWVVEAPDGRFAANCLVWLDEHNGVGELEPVGAHPEFRRRGLARAVCLAALHALRAAGARQAVVYPAQGVPSRPGAVPLYAGLGFRAYARTADYVLDSAHRWASSGAPSRQ